METKKIKYNNLNLSKFHHNKSGDDLERLIKLVNKGKVNDSNINFSIQKLSTLNENYLNLNDKLSFDKIIYIVKNQREYLTERETIKSIIYLNKANNFKKANNTSTDLSMNEKYIIINLKNKLIFTEDEKYLEFDKLQNKISKISTKVAKLKYCVLQSSLQITDKIKSELIYNTIFELLDYKLNGLYNSCSKIKKIIINNLIIKGKTIKRNFIKTYDLYFNIESFKLKIQNNFHICYSISSSLLPKCFIQNKNFISYSFKYSINNLILYNSYKLQVIKEGIAIKIWLCKESFSSGESLTYHQGIIPIRINDFFNFDINFSCCYGYMKTLDFQPIMFEGEIDKNIPEIEYIKNKWRNVKITCSDYLSFIKENTLLSYNKTQYGIVFGMLNNIKRIFLKNFKILSLNVDYIDYYLFKISLEAKKIGSIKENFMNTVISVCKFTLNNIDKIGVYQKCVNFELRIGDIIILYLFYEPIGRDEIKQI